MSAAGPSQGAKVPSGGSEPHIVGERGGGMTDTTVWRRIWHLGDDVDTDALAPGAYMQLGVDGIAPHCLELLEPAFAPGVRAGDVIVAGPNFGIGSSREQAAAVLVHLGVAAVIAPSFGGLFFRNAFNLGLLLLTCPAIDALRGQSDLAIESDPLRLRRRDGRVAACEPVPDFLLAMAQAGGLLPQLRQRLGAHASSHL